MVLEVSLIMVWFGSGFIDVIVDDLIRWWCFAGCWVSILWMVWSGSGFVDVVVDDLIRWWCFAGCWVSILLLGFDLHVL